MNVTARLIRLLTRAALFTALSISAVSARPHPADTLSVAKPPLPAVSPVIDDSLAASDSTLADSTEPLKPLDPLVAFRARSTLSMLYSDTLELQTVRPMAIARSFAFYADDILRLAPSLAGGGQPGQRLPAQVLDPGRWVRIHRRVPGRGRSGRPADIAGGLAHGAGGNPGAGRYPGQCAQRRARLERRGPPADPLTRRNPRPRPTWESARGAYDINKVGGGLRRRMFRTGAIQVQINKIQQSTEDFTASVENIQFYTRVQQQLSPRALLAIDGLFFSDGFRRGGVRQTADGRHADQEFSGPVRWESGLGYGLGLQLRFRRAAVRVGFGRCRRRSGKPRSGPERYIRPAAARVGGSGILPAIVSVERFSPLVRGQRFPQDQPRGGTSGFGAEPERCGQISAPGCATTPAAARSRWAGPGSAWGGATAGCG